MQNNNSAVLLIQTTIASYRFRKSLRKLQELRFGDCGERYTFLQFQNRLQEISNSDPASFETIQTFLNMVRQNMSIPKFTSVFIVAHYSDDIFSSQKRTPLERALLINSQLITTYLHHPTLRQTAVDTKNLLSSFSLLFSHWLRYDRKKQIEELCDIYFNLPKSFSLDASANQVEVQSLEGQHNNFRKLIRGHLVQIAGKNGLQLLVDYGEKMKVMEEKISQQVRTTMNNTYWKMFQTALEQEPPNYSQVIDRLHDIRNMFISLVGNSQLWTRQINEHLDIPYISQRIHHNTFDPPYLKNLITFMFESIRELGAPVNDDGVVLCHKNMLQKMTTSKSYAEFLPILFRNILERLTHLQKSVQIIRENKREK